MKKLFLNSSIIFSLLISFNAQAESSTKSRTKKSHQNKSDTVKFDEKISDQNLTLSEENQKSEVQKPESKKENSQNLTQGNIIGFNLMESRSEYREEFYDDTRPNKTKRLHSFKDTNRDGFDFNYKYAFNFDKFFVAPGFFYEKTKAKIVGHKLYDPIDNGTFDYKNQFVKVRNRAGIKTDIGYDFHDKFSPYFTTGISRISYKSQNFISYTNGVVIGSAIKNGSDYEWFYGLGFKSNLTENIFLNFEYQRQDFAAKTTLGSFSSYNSSNVTVLNTRLELYKVGVGYSF